MPSLFALFSLYSILFAVCLGSSGLEKRQDLSGLPSCSQSCLGTALSTSSGGCSQTDFACLCKSATFLKSSQSCYASSCSAADAASANAWGVKTCASIGVDVVAAGATNVTSSANATTSSAATTSSTPAAASAKSASSAIAIPSLSVLLALGLGSLFA